MTKCNDWTNYETWNVFLWISSDEGLHNIARSYPCYRAFTKAMAAEFSPAEIAFCTPDGVAWNDSKINHDEINAALSDQ